MDRQEVDKSGLMRSMSLDRVSIENSSLRRHSSRFSLVFPNVADDDNDEDEMGSVSEAGDIGDRELHGSKRSGSCRIRLSFENGVDKNAVIPIADDSSFLPSGTNTATTTAASAVKQEVDEKRISWILKYITCLSVLALFGILGVIARYYLEKLFGPGVVGATSDKSYMYLDLPSNMVGSFLMGWFGVIFKANLLKVSENLTVGITTGFLGSLTTFSGWNQKMLELSVEGKWVFAVLGFLIGLSLAAYSIDFGVETAKWFKPIVRGSDGILKLSCCICSCILDLCDNDLMISLVLLFILGVVWATCITLLKDVFNTQSGHAQLILACIVGPFGVWARWFLARLNGRGLGNRGLFKWIPFGTLAANVLAASIMAALAILKKRVASDACNTAATGVQIGLLGCLSTVSTFMAEFHAMRESKHSWRAYVYAMITILTSFAMGTLIYSIPVWVEGYD